MNAGTDLRSPVAARAGEPPLIAHVLYRFAVGGLENGVVNLINRLPRERYRHAIICVTDADPEFARRLTRDGVDIHCLHKRPGQDPAVWWRLFRLLRRLRPALVHTRNLSALEAQVPSFLAGVPARVHSEHGYDVSDPDGRKRRYQWLRRGLGVLVQRFIPLSRDLEAYLRDRVGIPARKLTQLYNGVDIERFSPDLKPVARGEVLPTLAADGLLFGTVGRHQAIKDPLNLLRAFVVLMQRFPQWRGRCGLVLVGDGPLRPEGERLIAQAGLADSVAFLGERRDVPALMCMLDVFVLPSRAEGISNTILEAMACALPVIATDVGGNAELLDAGHTGLLVAPGSPDALASAMGHYLAHPDDIRAHGQAGRVRVETHFSLPAMLAGYDSVYQSVLARQGRT